MTDLTDEEIAYKKKSQEEKIQIAIDLVKEANRELVIEKSREEDNEPVIDDEPVHNDGSLDVELRPQEVVQVPLEQAIEEETAERPAVGKTPPIIDVE